MESRKNGDQESVRERKNKEEEERQKKIDEAKAKLEEEHQAKKRKVKELRREMAKRRRFSPSIYAQTPRQREHKEYQKTTWWKDRRQELKEKFGHSCEICKSEKKIAVHHNNYFSKYREKDHDLIVLCYDCHSFFHNAGHSYATVFDAMVLYPCCLCASEAQVCVSGREERLRFCRICFSNFLKGKRFPKEYNFHQRFRTDDNTMIS